MITRVIRKQQYPEAEKSRTSMSTQLAFGVLVNLASCGKEGDIGNRYKEPVVRSLAGGGAAGIITVVTVSCFCNTRYPVPPALAHLTGADVDGVEIIM